MNQTTGIRVLNHRIALSVTIVVIFHHTKQVETVFSVVEVQFFQSVYVMGNTENRTAVETEPFPYRLYGFDADNGIDGSVILRSR